MNNITKDMKIEEVLNKYPETLEVFTKHGFHCFGCAAMSFESIGDGANAHKINVEKFIKDLNDAVENDQ